MCTMIANTSAVNAAGKGAGGWFSITQATVAFDHATHTVAEHALLLDFANYDIGPSARVALEMDLASGRALMEQLRSTIEAAERHQASPDGANSSPTTHVVVGGCGDNRLSTGIQLSTTAAAAVETTTPREAPA